MTPMKVFQTDVSFPEAPDGWLVLSMEHSGSRDTAYSHTFTAISAKLAYRPERITPRPHIDGTLPARVTAAENCTYAYIDDMGHYRVKLPFDLDEWSPGGESRPVRLAKPYAGPEYGIHFPLIQTAPAGIATATQQSQLHTAHENIHLVSGANTDISAGQSLTAHATESVNLFA